MPTCWIEETLDSSRHWFVSCDQTTASSRVRQAATTQQRQGGSSTTSQLLLAVTVIIMQRPNERNGASRASKQAEQREEERGGRSKVRSAKGATRSKMVEEMACKRGFVGKRTEPVVRRHLAAPYIFLFLFFPWSLFPLEQSTPPRSPSSFLLFSSVEDFHLSDSLHLYLSFSVFFLCCHFEGRKLTGRMRTSSFSAFSYEFLFNRIYFVSRTRRKIREQSFRLSGGLPRTLVAETNLMDSRNASSTDSEF